MKKLTRTKSNEFLRQYSSSEKTLIVGAGSNKYNDIFPNCLHTDIDRSAKVDMVADVESLPFEDESFDIVVCPAVLSHVLHPNKAVSEMHRVLRKGGKVIVTTAFIFPLNSQPVDFWRITENGMKLLFSNGWNIEVLKSDSRPFYTIAVLIQRILFQTDMRGGKLTKAIIFPFMVLISKLDFLIKREYGDIGRQTETIGFLTGGWLLCAVKIDIK